MHYDYHTARYYDPVLGNYLSVDPLAATAPGWTPYRFGYSNPINFTDPTGMLEDEYNYDVETGSLEWVSDKGGKNRQYVNVNKGDEQIGQTSVSGDEVYVYKLRNNVLVTNTDRNFDDGNYNRNSGYEYTKTEFDLRNRLLEEDTPISRSILGSERDGNAIPQTYSEEEKLYGYSGMRVRMLGMAINQSLDVFPTPSARIKRTSLSTSLSLRTNTGSNLRGSSGARAVTGSNSWHNFLKANTGVFKGSGWQKRAAAAYYNSSFYTP